MHAKILFPFFFAILPHLITSSPTPLLPRQDGPGHPYECEAKYNVAARKKELVNMGADAQDLAIAIMETGCRLSGTVYPFGDVTPDGKLKTGDSANFGLFKNNWGTIRRHCTSFQGKSQDEYRDGAVLNTNDKAAVKCQHQQMSALGSQRWFENQRGVGYGGAEYAKAIAYVADYLKQGHMDDGMVTYYTLHAV
ncbi:MAG: hypothetical protein LQ346_002095 [Caloplaca aetnensis]|nr:MAG: hypothetical protein LQ346_002095 [Caloplaca aetnensis]